MEKENDKVPFGGFSKVKNTKRIELNLCATFVVNAVGLLLAAWTTHEINFHNVFSFVALICVIGLFNCLLRPLLILFTLPFIIMTFGLGILLINALIIYLSAQVVPGIEIGPFWNAVWAAILVSLVMWANVYIQSEQMIKRAKRATPADKKGGDDDAIDV